MEKTGCTKCPSAASNIIKKLVEWLTAHLKSLQILREAKCKRCYVVDLEHPVLVRAQPLRTSLDGTNETIGAGSPVARARSRKTEASARDQARNAPKPTCGRTARSCPKCGRYVVV